MLSKLQCQSTEDFDPEGDIWLTGPLPEMVEGLLSGIHDLVEDARSARQESEEWMDILYELIGRHFLEASQPVENPMVVTPLRKRLA